MVCFSFSGDVARRELHSFPTRRSSDLQDRSSAIRSWRWSKIRTARPHKFDPANQSRCWVRRQPSISIDSQDRIYVAARSEEHTSELQSLRHLVCRLLLEKKKKTNTNQS